MEHKKVTPAQIEALYAFTRQHFVAYYDLQTEFTDHLANAIETRWEQNPNLAFDEALQLEFKKFGIFGFSDIVEQRQRALGKRYRKLMWGYFKHFIKLPRIVLTIAAMFIVYKIVTLQPLLYIAFIIALYIASFIKLRILNKQYKQKLAQTGKRWLLEDLIFRGGSAGSLAGVIVQSFQLPLQHSAMPAWIVALLSIFLVLGALYSYVILIIIPAKAEAHLAAAYPEYNLEKSA